MTDNVTLTWRVIATSSADALEAAKQRARDDGYRVRGVSRVDFTGERTWTVRLTVSPKEPMGSEPTR